MKKRRKQAEDLNKVMRLKQGRTTLRKKMENARIRQ
jgi:hypothetical protein